MHRELVIPNAKIQFPALSLLSKGIFLKSGGALRSKSFALDTIVERRFSQPCLESRVAPFSICIGRHSVSGAATFRSIYNTPERLTSGGIMIYHKIKMSAVGCMIFIAVLAVTHLVFLERADMLADQNCEQDID